MRQAPVVIAVYVTLTLALGGQWIAAKLGLNAVPPLELSAMRYLIASAALLIACAVTRTPLPWHRWRLIGAGALCGVVGFNTLAFVGLSLTPASDSALIIPTTIPVATALFATFLGDRFTRRKLAGFTIATAGAALIIAGGQQGGDGPSELRLRGDLLELGSAISWAASLTIGAIVLRTERVLGYVTLLVLIGTAVLVPLGALPQAYADVPSWTAPTWIAAASLGLFSTAVAFVLFSWAVRRFGPGPAAMVTYFTPVTALALAFLILGERPLPLQLVGGVVVVIGVRVAARRSRSRDRAALAS